MSRRLFILGSTGSIGCNAVEVVQHLRLLYGRDSWPVVGLAAGCNAALLAEQARALNVDAVSLAENNENECSVSYSTADELLKNHAKAGDLVLAAIVGFAGISPVLTAIECGCDIALANKESLVAGGQIVMNAAKEKGVNILPVDSEHSAIYQSLGSSPSKEVSKITLTASGGSLREMTFEELQVATVEQVLKHPTWAMGKKVTVDSASMMNKALELIEAHWFFGVDGKKLDAVIHPQSVVHGMVEFVDGSVMAQLSPPDMKLPIQYALTWPKRLDGCSPKLEWSKHPRLEFEQIDTQRYPAIQLAYDVIKQGGTAGAAFNAANEVVVSSFLEHSLPFGAMIAIVEEVLVTFPVVDTVDFETVVEADQEARRLAAALIASRKVNS